MKTTLSLCLLLSFSGLHARADLLDDFETTNVAVTVTRIGSVPGPQVMTNITTSVTNQFLRMVNDTIGSQNNQYSYNQTDTGAWENITASFDFRILSTNGPAADGMSLVLLPTSAYGTNGVGPTYVAEEPNLPGTLGFAIDAHPAAAVNDFALHWDGQELVNQTVPTNKVTIDDGIFHRAILELEAFGNGAYARAFVITNSLENPGAKTLILETFVPGLQPYEHRVQLAARTGGSTMDVDLDNVSVTYSNLYTGGLATITTNRLYQDFDRRGDTRAYTRQHSVDGQAGTVYRPGPIPMDDGAPRDTYLRLVHDGVNTSRNSLTFDQVGPSLVPAYRYRFDFRATSAGAAADGWSIALLPTRDFGATGIGPDIGAFEEPNRLRTLGFGFDMHPEANGTNDASVHWHGTEALNVTLEPNTEFDLNNAVWNRAECIIKQAVSGAVVNLILHPDIDSGTSTPVLAISDFFVPGFTNYEHRIQIGSRTGGAFHSFDVDNIIQTDGPKNAATSLTIQQFEGEEQTWFEAWQKPFATRRGAEIQHDAGSDGKFLRLVQAGIGNQQNSLCLDHTPQGSGIATGEVTTGQFDFRVLGGSTNNPADGLAFLLIPTNTYGTSGPGAYHVSPAITVEKPNLAGVLGIGVDIHNEAQGVNDISVHWDGTERAFTRLPVDYMDLDTNVFHRLDFEIDWTSTGAWVNVFATPDLRGTPGVQSNIIQVLIPDLLPFNYRVEVAARTGGATANIDVDNIMVSSTGSDPDSDRDELPDDWETTFFVNLGITDGLPGQDFDNDGFDDRYEFLAGTLPNDPTSRLALRAIRNDLGQLLEWDSVSGKRYRIWRRPDLLNGAWSPLIDGIDATDPLNTLQDTTSLTNRWLYRVELEIDSF